MPAGPTGLGHVNLRAPAALIERLLHFYRDVIGLCDGPRPSFRSGSRGYWLYAGGAPVLHLTVAAEDLPVAAPAGAFDHFALACSGLRAMRARLDAAGVAYAADAVAETGEVQLFLTDPSGTGVELTFAAGPVDV